MRWTQARWTDKSINRQKEGYGASPGLWLASIICLLLAGREYIPLPLVREQELKCWHTSCIMWHWSDERSLPKSSTLSWAGLQYVSTSPCFFRETHTHTPCDGHLSDGRAIRLDKWARLTQNKNTELIMKNFKLSDVLHGVQVCTT